MRNSSKEEYPSVKVLSLGMRGRGKVFYLGTQGFYPNGRTYKVFYWEGISWKHLSSPQGIVAKAAGRTLFNFKCALRHKDPSLGKSQIGQDTQRAKHQ